MQGSCNAKAVNVTSLVECARRYGSRSKTKDICGEVLEVVAKKKSLNCNTCFKLAEYDPGVGTNKIK